MNLFSLLLEVMILLGAWLCLAVWPQDPRTPGRRTFVLLTLAWMAWCLSDLASMRQAVPEATALIVGQIGLLAFAPLWLGVSAQAAQLPIARRVPWFPIALLVPGAVMSGLLFSSNWRGLYLNTVESGTNVPGPLFEIMSLYNLALVLAGCAGFAVAAVRWRQPDQLAHRLCVGAAPLVLIVGNALSLGTGWPEGLDPTPVLIGVALALLHRGMFTGGLLQPLPVSQHALIQQLPIGMLLADCNGVVVDVNRVAERHLGMTADAAMGRNFDAVIQAAQRGLRFEVTTVMSAGAEAGQIVLLDPPHKRASTRISTLPPAADSKDSGAKS